MVILSLITLIETKQVIVSQKIKKIKTFWRACNLLWDKKYELETKSFYPNFGIGQIYIVLKFIKEKIEKKMAQISIWKCGIGILDKDPQSNSLELKCI